MEHKLLEDTIAKPCVDLVLRYGDRRVRTIYEVTPEGIEITDGTCVETGNQIEGLTYKDLEEHIMSNPLDFIFTPMSGNIFKESQLLIGKLERNKQEIIELLENYLRYFKTEISTKVGKIVFDEEHSEVSYIDNEGNTSNLGELTATELVMFTLTIPNQDLHKGEYLTLDDFDEEYKKGYEAKELMQYLCEEVNENLTQPFQHKVEISESGKGEDFVDVVHIASRGGLREEYHFYGVHRKIRVFDICGENRDYYYPMLGNLNLKFYINNIDKICPFFKDWLVQEHCVEALEEFSKTNNK